MIFYNVRQVQTTQVYLKFLWGLCLFEILIISWGKIQTWLSLCIKEDLDQSQCNGLHLFFFCHADSLQTFTRHAISLFLEIMSLSLGTIHAVHKRKIFYISCFLIQVCISESVYLIISLCLFNCLSTSLMSRGRGTM